MTSRVGASTAPCRARGGKDRMGFDEIYPEVARLSIVPEDRCRALFDLASRASVLDGDVAEVGVYKGGTALMLAEVFPRRTVYAFDTFGGMPGTADVLDVHKPGDFADTSIEAVRAALAGHANVDLRLGLFPETARGLESRVFCFAHFDGDLYQSCRDFISFFSPRMVPGGIMVFDDWEWHGCPGVKRAIGEAGLAVLESARYQCYSALPRRGRAM